MTTEMTPATDGGEDEGFDWAIVEVFGHRRHAGRTREEERFGAKMLRIDIPTVELRDDGAGVRGAAITGWTTLFYAGAAIFSLTPTDKATALRANRPHEPAGRLTYREADSDVDEEF